MAEPFQKYRPIVPNEHCGSNVTVQCARSPALSFVALAAFHTIWALVSNAPLPLQGFDYWGALSVERQLDKINAARSCAKRRCSAKIVGAAVAPTGSDCRALAADEARSRNGNQRGEPRWRYAIELSYGELD